MNLGIEKELHTLDMIAYTVTEGEVNPLEGLLAIKALEKKIADIKLVIEPLAIEEANKFEKTFEFSGAKITRTEGRAMYEFDHIASWKKLNEDQKKIEEAAKQAATISKIGQLVTEDGEVVEPALVTYSKPSLSVTFLKK